MADQIFRDSDADRTLPPEMVARARGDLFGPDPLDLHLPLPDLLDAHDLLQGRARRDAGPHGALGRLRAEVASASRSLGLSPDTIFAESTVRAEFMKRFWNSTIIALGLLRSSP